MMQFLKKYWESAIEKLENKRTEIDYVRDPSPDRLILYYNYYSYYSQKVLMALHEKQLEFEPVAVDITRGEQYSDWFLRLNPRGEVPVLVHGARVVPDSTRILDYLEQHVPGERKPLLVVSSEATLSRRVAEMRDQLDALPAGVITMGSFFHPDLCGRPKLPFILSVRNTLKNAEINNSSNLRRLAAEHPAAQATLLYKAEIHERKHELLADRDEYEKVLAQVDRVLTLVETQLAEQPPGHWLCCSQFTLADISLTVLLERLYVLGLEGRYWAAARPHLAAYYARVRERSSYRAAVPDLPFHLKYILASQPPAVLGVATLTSLTAVAATLYILKRIVF